MTADVIHQFNDPSHRTLVRELIDHPEYEDLIKCASLDPAYAEDLESTAFAWPERRLFPIDTEDNATLSYIYAEKNASVPSYVKEDIKEVLDLYGVELPDLAEKTASEIVNDDSCYLLPEIQRWKVTDEGSVKLAAEALIERHGELDLDSRTTAAVRLLKIASAYSNDTQFNDHMWSTKVAQMAGATASNTRVAVDWVEARAVAAPPEYKEAYQKVASMLMDVEPISYDRPSLIKLAEVIHKLDTSSGLSDLYGRLIPDPILTVFNTEKLAEDTVDLAGTSVPMSKMMTVPVAHYEDIFGEDITPEITTGGELDPVKVAQVIGTMPRDLKMVLRTQMGV